MSATWAANAGDDESAACPDEFTGDFRCHHLSLCVLRELPAAPDPRNAGPLIGRVMLTGSLHADGMRDFDLPDRTNVVATKPRPFPPPTKPQLVHCTHFQNHPAKK